jgi:hypothetical protein
VRWLDVPFIDGNTDPLGSVHSPYAGLGIAGPLRLAPSQPALVGEDLGLSATTTAFRGGRVPFKVGRPFLRGYGELAPSAPQMDANFSTSPTQISSQAGAAQNAQGFHGYGATLVASNHYGAVYQAGVISQKRVSAPAMIADVLSVLRNVGRGEGLDTASAMTVRQGLPVSEAAVEVIASRKLGKKDLESRIASLEAKAAVAKSKGDTAKYNKLRVRAAALRARLKDVRAGKVQAVRDLPEVAGDKGRIPSWVTWAGLALGAASLVVAVMAVKRRKGKKT